MTISVADNRADNRGRRSREDLNNDDDNDDLEEDENARRRRSEIRSEEKW